LSRFRKEGGTLEDDFRCIMNKQVAIMIYNCQALNTSINE
jgi:hypothetical protein